MKGLMGVRSRQAGGRWQVLDLVWESSPVSFRRDSRREEGKVPLLHRAAKTGGYSAPLVRSESLQPFDS